MTEGDEDRVELLNDSKVIAIVGLSPDTQKASNIVAKYLLQHGYRIIPVNPGHPEILGQRSYPSLSDIPEKVDIVDIFMRAERVVPVVKEAVALKPRAIWLQLGIINDEARGIAENAGIPFVMDLCIKQEHDRLFRKNQMDDAST